MLMKLCLEICVCILSLNKMRTSTIKMQFVQILEAAITVTATATGTKTCKLQVATLIVAAAAATCCRCISHFDCPLINGSVQQSVEYLVLLILIANSSHLRSRHRATCNSVASVPLPVQRDQTNPEKIEPYSVAIKSFTPFSLRLAYRNASEN